VDYIPPDGRVVINERRIVENMKVGFGLIEALSRHFPWGRGMRKIEKNLR
jgi:hypothetical protein